MTSKKLVYISGSAPTGSGRELKLTKEADGSLVLTMNETDHMGIVKRKCQMRVHSIMFDDLALAAKQNE